MITKERLFLDTSFIQALLNQADQWHAQAKALELRAEAAAEVIVTEAILLEVGNALSGMGERLRKDVAEYIQKCYLFNNNIQVVGVDSSLLLRALERYKSYKDKTWGLVDCISFVVMEDNGLTIALTSDRDFVQARFRALMLEPNP